MPAGRPKDLTPEVIEDVRRILPTVLYLETVADYIGVTRFAIRLWIRRGKKEEKRLRRANAKPDPKEAIYLEFFNVFKKALAEGEISAIGVIKKASATQWQAGAWLAERRFYEHWGSERHLVRDLMKRVTELEAERLASAKEDQKSTEPPGGAKKVRNPKAK